MRGRNQLQLLVCSHKGISILTADISYAHAGVGQVVVDMQSRPAHSALSGVLAILS